MSHIHHLLFIVAYTVDIRTGGLQKYNQLMLTSALRYLTTCLSIVIDVTSAGTLGEVLRVTLPALSTTPHCSRSQSGGVCDWAHK